MFRKKKEFWFATGGAGFCISHALAVKMLPVAGNGKFIKISEEIHCPDDVSMGYICEKLLNTELTIVDQFHSHYESMNRLSLDTLHEQVSFSYGNGNVVKINGFSLDKDPHRIYSLHCHLFPYFNFCSDIKR